MNVGLLKKIQKEILVEPRRLNMERWLHNFVIPIGNDDPLLAPCGSVGCIAGHAIWIDGLKKTDRTFKDIVFVRTFQTKYLYHVERKARRLLRLTVSQSQRLFFLEQWPKQLMSEYNQNKRSRQKCAEITSKRIALFIETKGLV